MFTDAYLQEIERELGIYGSASDTLSNRLEVVKKTIRQLKKSKQVNSFLLLEEMTENAIRFDFEEDSRFGTTFEKAKSLIDRIRK